MGGSLPKIAGFAVEDQNPGYRSGMFPDNGLTNSKGVPYIWGPGFPIENTPTKNLANNELGNAERKRREAAGEGKAKVRPEALQNKVDKKSSGSKVLSSKISSGGIRKRTKTSSPTSKRVAALLKTKDTSNNKDSGDKLG
jgi:hypothetical protein